MFLNDINRLSARENSWVIPILGACGTKDRSTHLHFCYNTTKHDATYSDPQAHIKDYTLFDRMYEEMAEQMSHYDLRLDKNEWYAIGKDNIERFIKADNVFTLRVECFVYMFNANFLEVIKQIADTMNHTLEHEVSKSLPPEMVTRPIEHDFGMSDYVEI